MHVDLGLAGTRTLMFYGGCGKYVGKYKHLDRFHVQWSYCYSNGDFYAEI